MSVRQYKIVLTGERLGGSKIPLGLRSFISMYMKLLDEGGGFPDELTILLTAETREEEHGETD